MKKIIKNILAGVEWAGLLILGYMGFVCGILMIYIPVRLVIDWIF